MAGVKNLIEWCVVRIGDDMNWWVTEVSDDVHWDVDGLSIIDPRQMSHIIDLLEPLREYNLDQDIVDRGFIPFKIQKDLGDGLIRLTRTNESFFDTEEALFGLPDVVDEENGPFADLITHLMKNRVALLNDVIDFEQDLTVDEVEEHIREDENNDFIEGKATHLFNEITTVLDYVPAGWELDGDDDEASEEDEIDDYPDIDEEEEANKISQSENLKWDEDEEEEEEEQSEETSPPEAPELDEKEL